VAAITIMDAPVFSKATARKQMPRRNKETSKLR